ncbi:alpha/beta hydrolase [Flammeovirgaceae bacterium SG7u.111]|nr:alpha/beta hydrolase [Flammeovirgaceae bacterium SG7u.132]WPO36422.1 alpha/beta hydrolase [Flammeovirgaceae bacterium SG7u.111]
MKIYVISGLGADKRIFQFLTLKYQLVPLDWIEPKKNEPLESYAARLSQSIDTSKDFILLGVSFGGLVATEIGKFLSPKQTILISSAETAAELRSIYRLFGKLNLIRFIPKPFLNMPAWLANLLFGAKNKQLLAEIIQDTDLGFLKWALAELMQWKNQTRLPNCLKIEGGNDLLLPPTKSTNAILIPQGGHFMIVDKAEEISGVINERIASLGLGN